MQTPDNNASPMKRFFYKLPEVRWHTHGDDVSIQQMTSTGLGMTTCQAW
jgi:hypothetical protein